jgi:hypothetical protein
MAQLNGANFLSKWATLFADNTAGEISALDMRDFRQDLVDSFPNLLDDAYETFVVTAAGTNTYTATLSPAITAYASTHRYFIKFTNGNTGASTLNLNGLGAKAIVKNGSTALESGDISAGQVLELVYDGTNLQIMGNTRSTSDVKTARVVLSSSQILNGFTTPVQVIAAPGAGKFIQLMEVAQIYYFGTTAYLTNTNGNLDYNGSTTMFQSMNFSGVANSVSMRLHNQIGPATSVIENTAITWFVSGGNPTAGDGTIELDITYRIIDL